jgi:hypothetical protein
MTVKESVEPSKKPGFWAVLWRTIVAIDEASDVTEASILAERVVRLEREVSNINARLSDRGGESGTGRSPSVRQPE